jgi:hypothetical protein
MMIFLIHYKRSSGKIIQLTEFQEMQRGAAEDARLALELSLMGHKDGDEVCLLEAASIEALKKTHRRYFENLSQLTASGSSTVASVRGEH